MRQIAGVQGQGLPVQKPHPFQGDHLGPRIEQQTLGDRGRGRHGLRQQHLVRDPVTAGVEALGEAAQPVQPLHVLPRHDERPDSGDTVDQTLHAQQPEDVPHDVAAGLEVRGQLRFGGQWLGAVYAREDAGAQHVPDAPYRCDTASCTSTTSDDPCHGRNTQERLLRRPVAGITHRLRQAAQRSGTADLGQQARMRQYRHGVRRAGRLVEHSVRRIAGHRSGANTLARPGPHDADCPVRCPGVTGG